LCGEKRPLSRGWKEEKHRDNAKEGLKLAELGKIQRGNVFVMGHGGRGVINQKLRRQGT